MSDPITLDALRALDAIDREGSFAAAAESLHKVPSALSYTIKKLEEELGAVLFDRAKQRAILTPAGKLVLEKGRNILLETHRLTEAVHMLESGWEAEISIARDTTIAQQPLLDLIGQFMQLEHKVNVSLGVEALRGGWDALHNRRADIVIGANGDLPKGLFATHKIGELSFVFAVAASHPLAKCEDIIQPEQLREFTSVIVADSSQYLPLGSVGLFESNNSIRVNTMDAKIQLQKSAAGVGFLPKHLITEELSEGSLIEKQCALPRPALPLFIAWHKHQQGKAISWFIDKLCKTDWQLNA